MGNRKISVYDEDGEVVGRVEYQSNLDCWDGHNFSSGGTGLHKGITRLTNGAYVVIHGSQFQGSRDRGEIISAEEALQLILRNDAFELLELKKFQELKKSHDKSIEGEME